MKTKDKSLRTELLRINDEYTNGDLPHKHVHIAFLINDRIAEIFIGTAKDALNHIPLNLLSRDIHKSELIYGKHYIYFKGGLL